MSQRKPTITQRDLDVLLAFLIGKSWLTARELHGALGFNDRKLRALAEASDGRIVTGNDGYKLTEEATIDEVLAFQARMLNQSRKTAHRVSRTATQWALAQEPKESAA